MLEAAFKQSAGAVSLPIYRLNIRIEQYIDEFGDRNVAILPQQKMVMIGHQAVSDERYLIGDDMFFYEAQAVKVIFLAKEDRVTVCTAIVDMEIAVFAESITSGHLILLH